MGFDEDIKRIMEHAHFWNWLPDWGVVQDVYQSYPESYSVLTPFAYAYLEELIRSTTSEYGKGGFDQSGSPRRYAVGRSLIKMAIDENKSADPKLIELLEKMNSYFSDSHPTDNGDNRNSVVHGFMHARFWDKEPFENLVHDIALLSEYAGF